jgi:pimeloyl-ACP methyl ester carboxylesterase
VAADSVSLTAPSLVVTSPDDTPIAVFSSGEGSPLVLVHGATADHTAFRVVGPMLAATFTVHAIDRRGRGASGDGAGQYSIEREFEDVAAVAETITSASGRPVDVFGHSYGGRCALGAALLTDAIRRVISYEGAPTPPGSSYHPAGVETRLRERLAAGDRDGALATFLTEVVGMSAPDLAAYRADPIWPVRTAAVGTILRELEAEADPAASLDRLAGVRQPVLQILGGESIPVFREATVALDARLADSRIVVIDGARHAAHHTHPDQVVEAVQAFLA